MLPYNTHIEASGETDSCFSNGYLCDSTETDAPLNSPYPPTAPVSRSTSPFGFLKLPPEIRCMIYAEVLVIGKVFFRPAQLQDEIHEIMNSGRFVSWDRYRRPELQLLRVCKLVHKEAEEIYLGRNLFVLPVQWHLMHPFVSAMTEMSEMSVFQKPQLFSTLALKKLKNLSIAIDVKDLSDCGPTTTSRAQGTAHSANFTDPSDGFRLAHAHRTVIIQALTNAKGWGLVTHTLTQLRRSLTTSLDYIEVDLTNAFCPTRCCRPVHVVKFNWVHALQPKKICVLGLRSEREKAVLLEHVQNFDYVSSRMLREEHGLEFRKDCQGTEWEAYVMKGEGRRNGMG
ncbi:hypothetical protein BDV95DRAFT_588148 [Massariosphaeria phaeospora]|uniref:F-box domain-containing protein n=1 Tax=Massariosphaeria phaeospora TaxID=100035 RepID=A0A7C8M153_9PLEO|nr:hypothetical protein BDV95DRAFT_588148 [Massariosphaeria phaeospora]